MIGGPVQNEPNSNTNLATPEWYDEIRSALIRKQPADFEHELPGLIETVQTIGENPDDTVSLVIGISFSVKGTCLDYTVDRVIEVEGRDEPVIETIKEPVSTKHRYVTFSYTPDPQFDNHALRSLLLAALDRERSLAVKQGNEPTGLARIWRNFAD